MPQASSSAATDAPAETERSLRHVLSKLSDFGDDPAVLTLEDDELATVSYAGLAKRIEAATADLADRGVGKGDRVAILGRNSADWMITCLAVVNAGAVAVPVDATLDRDSLEHVLGDCEPRLIFVDERKRERVEGVLPDGSELLDLGKQETSDGNGERARLPDLDANETAVLFYTSGTTGPPKGVPLTHANLMFELDRLTEMGLVERGERLLLPLPLHHVYPFVVGLLAALVYGVGIVFPRSLTGPDMQAAMREGGVTTVLGVPRLYETMITGIDQRAEAGGLVARNVYRALSGASLYCHRRLSLPIGRLLMRPARRKVAPDLRLLASGGAALDPDLAWRLDSFGWTVATGYGLTETSPMLSILQPGEKHFDSAGQPVPGVELRIAPEEDVEGEEETETEEGYEIGEIQARGPNIFNGYLDLPEKTDEAFTDDGWYRTEDRGYIDDEGYLHVLGRSSLFAVTEAGENISLEELEKTYAQHPLIREIGIFMRDNQLRAVAVPDQGALRERGGDDVEQAVEEAVDECASDLPKFKRVVEVAVSGDALARTLLGKIRRDKLEERFDAHREGGGLEESGPMPIEEMPPEDRELLENPDVRAVWEHLAERYETIRLTPDSDVAADLGIDSLEWVNVTLDIMDRTGVELTEEATSRTETVRDLLQEVQSASGASRETAADVTEEPERFLSDDQKRWLRPLSRAEVALAWLIYQINRAFVRLYFRMRVEGLEHLRSDDQVVVLPNHTSYLDGFVIMAALPFDFLRRTVIAGSEEIAFATPVHRFAMRLARALPIQGQRAAFSSLALPLVTLRDGTNLIWFPEGRRSPDGELQQVRPGIGMLLAEHPTTTVPVIIAGTHEAMPMGRAIPRPRRVTVHLGQPVPAEKLVREGEGDEKRQKIASAIQNELEELKSAVAA